VGKRIVSAAETEPLQREINLRMQGYRFEWEFDVFENDQVNAFCLPAGKVGVFTGLLEQLEPSDDQLAAVISHEVAHALAHHASERLARYDRLRDAADGLQSNALSEEVIGILVPALRIGDLAHDRQQESEADHIGVFLMAFADYDPHQAVAFWEQMNRGAGRRGQPPEILSNHPSNARRIAQLREWVPMARGAKKAYDEGNIVRD
jgi:predicted Zn-dependent protease